MIQSLWLILLGGVIASVIIISQIDRIVESKVVETQVEFSNKKAELIELELELEETKQKMKPGQ